jgi:hypothetical protein
LKDFTVRQFSQLKLTLALSQSLISGLVSQALLCCQKSKIQNMDAQKLDELARRFKTSPGRILDILIDLRNKGCPPEMLGQVLYNELLIQNFTTILKRFLAFLAASNFIISSCFVFFQLSSIPSTYRYDEVLKSIIFWGFLGVILSATLSGTFIVFCRKIIERFSM